MILLCLGRRGLGKTTLARCISGRCDRAIIVDPRAMWDTPDPLGDFPDDELEFIKRLEDGRKTIVIQPIDLPQETFDRLAVLSRSYLINSPGKWAILIDECALLDLKSWSWWWRCSPRDRVWLILTSHRPQDVPTTIRALADYWACFRMTQEHDLDAIRERCGKDFGNALANIQAREFLLWDDATARATMYPDPKVWYAPLNADVSEVTITLTEGTPILVKPERPRLF